MVEAGERDRAETERQPRERQQTERKGSENRDLQCAADAAREGAMTEVPPVERVEHHGQHEQRLGLDREGQPDQEKCGYLHSQLGGARE